MSRMLFIGTVIMLLACSVFRPAHAGQRGWANDKDASVRSLEEVWEFILSIDWRGFIASLHEKNSKNIYEYTFNDDFAGHHVASNFFTDNESGLVDLKEKLLALEKRAENSSLSTQNKTDWQPIADQLVDAYGNETAAVAYCSAKEMWILCGWVNLTSTFVNSNTVTRMCASCLSVGLMSPERTPIPGTDYQYGLAPAAAQATALPSASVSSTPVPPSPVPEGEGGSGSDDEDDDEGEDGDDGSGESGRILVRERRGEGSERPSVRSYQMVDLFTNPDDSCEEGAYESDLDECGAFCCDSVYESSEFCGSGGYCL